MTMETDKDFLDDQVSRTYREASSQRVSEDLNQRILKMAGDEVRPKGTLTNFFDSWTKPLAWAATIGLSLAIVLDVSQQSSEIVTPDAVPAESLQEQFKPKNESQFEDARNQAELRSGPSEDSFDAAPQAASQPAPASAPQARSQSVPATPEAESAEPAAGAVSAKRQSFAPREISPATEEVAEQLVSDHFSAAVPMSNEAERLETKKSASRHACSESIKERPDIWLACIEAMRIDGALDDAEREYEEYLQAFPNE